MPALRIRDFEGNLESMFDRNYFFNYCYLSGPIIFRIYSSFEFERLSQLNKASGVNRYVTENSDKFCSNHTLVKLF